MKTLLTLLILLSFAFAAGATITETTLWPEARSPDTFQVYKFDIESTYGTDNGSIDYNTTAAILGKLYAITFLNLTNTTQNATLNGTIYLNASSPIVKNIYYYDMASGNTTVYPHLGANGTERQILTAPIRLDWESAADWNASIEVLVYVER